ncbi:hypothetical protein SULPSESMR1_01880 [Pseudosulfitobacter pseudonitzschiae]|jgi:hypothetical protein|uniref:Uncharacterized protein n=2 Tax=Rhodobacterales TaxID=204455 RepID=A0A221K114_9RHOB|nr:hypothetical protein SULPSESMR1_01880 [Pseudosulfitobacter pseudonitzschiae]
MPLVVVTLLGALWVFRLGWIWAHLDESALLDHYARLYVAETGAGASPSDCVGRPGEQAAVRLVISCTTPQGSRRVYLIGRFGGLLDQLPAPRNAAET